MSALSEGNQRHWEFYVVKNLDTKRKLSEASPFAGCAKMHLSVLYYAIEKSVDIRTMYKLI